MIFTDDEIIIEPLYYQRDWQSCNYTVRGQHLFHERTYHIGLYGKGGLLYRLLSAKTQAERDAVVSAPDPTRQWFDCIGTRAEIEAIGKKHGGYAREDFYPADDKNPMFFLEFKDTDKALAFCRTEDFDRLCKPLSTTGSTQLSP